VICAASVDVKAENVMGVALLGCTSNPPVHVIVATVPAARASPGARVMTCIVPAILGDVAAALRPIAAQEDAAPLQIAADDVIAIFFPALSAFVSAMINTIRLGIVPTTRVLGVAEIHTILVSMA
jgi:hypothetical protein|tara:strand:+ start:5841 stop:6215 length:375 start_codon:yes stop_codon:yes gene_type:complete